MSDRRYFFKHSAGLLGLGAYAGLFAEQAAAEPITATPPALNPPPTKSGAHLGNLYPEIAQMAAGGDPSLSFLRPEFQDLAAWQDRARRRLLELLYYAPPAVKPEAQITHREDRGDYIQETLTFNTTPWFRVPAFVLIPKRAKLPAPGIVALHDHGGFYLWGKEKLTDNPQEHPALTDLKSYYDNRPIAAELAKQGYVVIVIDMYYWGQRRLLLDDDLPDWRDRSSALTLERAKEYNQRSAAYEQLLGRTLHTAGITWPGIMFWDDVRTVDYLVSRPEVDANRLGCVGHSIGGLRATHLAVLDSRIKAAVCSGWMCSFPRQLFRHVRSTIGPTKLLPGLYRELDYPDVASIAMPCAQLYINGRRDGLFDLEGVQAAFDKLTRCYRKAGIADRFSGRLFDTPHEFNTQMQQEAWDWFARHLS